VEEFQHGSYIAGGGVYVGIRSHASLQRSGGGSARRGGRWGKGEFTS